MLQIAICDDDRCFTQKLTALLNSYAAGTGEDFKIVAFTDASSFLSSAVETYDAVFLDVCLGEANGMDVAATLRQRNPDVVLVFVSAFAQYALGGYRLRALDYLLKNDIEQLFPVCMQRIMEELRLPKKQFSCRTISGVDMVCRTSQILYFESVGHDVKLHLDTTPPTCYVIYSTLSKVGAKLHDRNFVRIQRSYLVNMGCVAGIKGPVLTLSDGTTLTCSRQKQKEILGHYLAVQGRL